MEIHSELITIRGQVQGVGFRPLVWNLAQTHGILGEVRNDASGLTILAQAKVEKISRFIEDIQSNTPPLATIQNINRQHLASASAFTGFSIESSLPGPADTSVIADAATGPQCLAEIRDPGNRRYRHAFSNCTHCGPRISITRGIPYDRVNTSMAAFPMCKNCASEYADPTNRRFHAQPICCPDCGPRLELKTGSGHTVETRDCITKTAELLMNGEIVAIKGTGGFQLACLAENDAAVRRLRSRKNRPDKPLALMATSIDQISRFCELDQTEVDLLQSPAAPIVLLRCNNPSQLSDAIAPGQSHLGFMLPNSPLHHLLLDELPGPIILTSGNASDEPQCLSNQQALDRLDDIADYFLIHDRDIVNRMDDSVVRVHNGDTRFLRRARGYAPQPASIPGDLKGSTYVLACGAQMKNTFALQRGDQVILSQHIGNLDNPLAIDDYKNNISLYQAVFEHAPKAVAADLHADYQSSRFAEQLARQHNLPLIRIQHHHAHIAACLADNLWPATKPVLGIALDGLGLGDDGEIWGGEFMVADYEDFKRLASLRPVPMAGGDRASIEPWRNTVAQLKTANLWAEARAIIADIGEFMPLLQSVDQLSDVIDSDYRFPLTSSCGRLFDAVAAILGICTARMSYEGQAASELESLQSGIDLSRTSPYPFDRHIDELLRIDPSPMWSALLGDIEQGIDKKTISARFHAGLAEVIVDTASLLSNQTGVSTVALSGGVFQNQSLLTRCLELFAEAGLPVLQQRLTPCNDGGIALGQAVIAAAHCMEKH